MSQINDSALNSARSEGLNWLLEMEALDNPHLKNILILNILKISKRVINTELVMDTRNKKILIYLELTKWGNWFNREKIATQIADMIGEILPSYELRVTYSKELLEKSIEVSKKSMISLSCEDEKTEEEGCLENQKESR